MKQTKLHGCFFKVPRGSIKQLERLAHKTELEITHLKKPNHSSREHMLFTMRQRTKLCAIKIQIESLKMEEAKHSEKIKP